MNEEKVHDLAAYIYKNKNLEDNVNQFAMLIRHWHEQNPVEPVEPVVVGLTEDQVSSLAFKVKGNDDYAVRVDIIDTFLKTQKFVQPVVVGLTEDQVSSLSFKFRGHEDFDDRIDIIDTFLKTQNFEQPEIKESFVGISEGQKTRFIIKLMQRLNMVDCTEPLVTEIVNECLLYSDIPTCTKPEPVVVGLTNEQVELLSCILYPASETFERGKEIHHYGLTIKAFLKTQKFELQQKQFEPDWDNVPLDVSLVRICAEHLDNSYRTIGCIRILSNFERPAPLVEVGQVWQQNCDTFNVIGVGIDDVAIQWDNLEMNFVLKKDFVDKFVRVS